MVSYAFGFVSALVVIQFVPKVSYIGAWVVKKATAFWQGMQ